MKKLLLIILSVVVVSSAFAGIGDFDSKGVISGWKFAPVQLSILSKDNAQLFDGKTPCLTAFGYWESHNHLRSCPLRHLINCIITMAFKLPLSLLADAIIMEFQLVFIRHGINVMVSKSES